MLVSAGLEDKTPAEIAAAYEAAFHADEAAVNILPAHVFPRATEHIPEMVALAERLEDAGLRLRLRGGQRLLRGRGVRGLRAAVGQLARRAPRRPSRRGRARQARPRRLRPVEGGRRGPHPQVADAALGRRLSGLAPRVLGDGDALSRRPVRHPHRRHRQRLPAPRGRDRAVGAARRRAAGQPLGPRRVPADVRPEDGQVRGQLPARHRALGPRHRSAGVALPGADGAVQPQARLLGRLDPGRGRRARVAPIATARRWARRRVDGPWVAPTPVLAGAAGDRPEGVADGIAGHGAERRDDAAPDRAHAPLAPLSDAGLAFHRRFVDAIDDDLDMSGALAIVREILRSDLSADERRWLVLDADAVLGLSLRHGLGRRRRLGRRRGPGGRRRARRGAFRRPGRPGLRPRRCAPAEIEAAGWTVTRRPGRLDRQPGRVSRSRRAPNRSMIR